MTNIEVIHGIQTRLRKQAQEWAGRSVEPGTKGALIRHLNDFAGSDAMRRLILYVWFRSGGEIEGLSTKKLTSGEWFAVQELADTFEHEKVWYVSAKFQQYMEQTKAYVLFRLS